MILKFDEFINEGVESIMPLKSVKKMLIPFGWSFVRGSGDGYKVSRGKCVVYFHLGHNASKDDNRYLDVGGLDEIRTDMIDEFKKSGDPTEINTIPWDKWRLPNPFDRELKGYDRNTGEKIVVSQTLNTGHKLQKLKVEKSIRDANELYKDASIIKIDENDENSAYILVSSNKFGNIIYNTCRSSKDRRPILKNWYLQSNFEKKGYNYYFGKDDARIWKVKYYRVLSDGTLEKTVNHIKENKSEKNLELL